jgi:hypothetical protein
VRIFTHKNTGDLQGAGLRKYNISPCNREKKINRPETGKNRREKQAETIEKQGTALLAATKNPPMSSGGRHSHKSETRISAIADFARKGKREKKALPLFLRSAAAIAPRLREGRRA